MGFHKDFEVKGHFCLSNFMFRFYTYIRSRFCRKWYFKGISDGKSKMGFHKDFEVNLAFSVRDFMFFLHLY